MTRFSSSHCPLLIQAVPAYLPPRTCEVYRQTTRPQKHVTLNHQPHKEQNLPAPAISLECCNSAGPGPAFGGFSTATRLQSLADGAASHVSHYPGIRPSGERFQPPAGHHLPLSDRSPRIRAFAVSRNLRRNGGSQRAAVVEPSRSKTLRAPCLLQQAQCRRPLA